MMAFPKPKHIVFELSPLINNQYLIIIILYAPGWKQIKITYQIYVFLYEHEFRK
jgi:hypothetical protein